MYHSFLFPLFFHLFVIVICNGVALLQFCRYLKACTWFLSAFLSHFWICSTMVLRLFGSETTSRCRVAIFRIFSSESISDKTFSRSRSRTSRIDRFVTRDRSGIECRDRVEASTWTTWIQFDTSICDWAWNLGPGIRIYSWIKWRIL